MRGCKRKGFIIRKTSEQWRGGGKAQCVFQEHRILRFGQSEKCEEEKSRRSVWKGFLGTECKRHGKLIYWGLKFPVRLKSINDVSNWTHGLKGGRLVRKQDVWISDFEGRVVMSDYSLRWWVKRRGKGIVDEEVVELRGPGVGWLVRMARPDGCKVVQDDNLKEAYEPRAQIINNWREVSQRLVGDQ